MSVIRPRIASFAIAGLLCGAVSSAGMAQTSDTSGVVIIESVDVTVYRVKEPVKAPIAKSETRGRAPSKDAVWLSGFWNMQGDRNTGTNAGWVWVPGRWITPPFRGAHWVPAHWGWADDWWSWMPGHWSKENIFVEDPSFQ